MNVYQALPLLEGWDFFVDNKMVTVQKGQFAQVFSRSVKGWLLALDMTATDPYTILREINLGLSLTGNMENLFDTGATLPPAFGAYVCTFIRPSILSSAGIFYMSAVTTAEPFPVRGLVRLELSLGLSSTQVTAVAGTSITAIEITDEKVFISSVRRLQYGWFGLVLDFVLNHLPGFKYVGLPKEIKEVVMDKEAK